MSNSTKNVSTGDDTQPKQSTNDIATDINNTAIDIGVTTEIEAAVFRRFLQHLDSHKEVQNIDLMILADFCRNCLSKWYVAEAKERGVELDYEQGRELVYGMPYSQWKELHQLEATPEQMEKFNNRGK